jgi:O-antigen/teichoic acid export membrane protein
MNKKRLVINIVSNWVFFIMTILMAFIVSPIMVNQLGNEAYGVWVLIVSIGSFFTVLDFGINTAIVRYISKYIAVNDHQKARQIYSSSFAIFIILGFFALVLVAISGLYFKQFFNIESFSNRYLYLVFLIVGFDLTLNLIFGVLSGTMRGLQKFLEINIILITVTLLKNTVLIYLLLNDYSLLSLAMLLISANSLKYLAQYLFIKKRYRFLKFSIQSIDKSTLKILFNYSIYSFLIAVALKILFSTDSIVIGALISVEDVTFYAIPAMIVENLQKLVWAVVAVLIPIISSREATGNGKDNRTLYVLGTKYTLLLCSPIIIVLIIVGDDFIRIWMGESYSEPSSTVLSLLLLGYIFSLSQMISQGILKGISKHKVLAIIFCVQALFNLILSVLLAPTYGIYGVAFGTAFPLLITNIFIVPFFTCKVLKLEYFSYILNSMFKPIFPIFILFILLYSLDIHVSNYIELFSFSLLIVLLIGLYTIIFQLEKEYRDWCIGKIKLLKRRK